MPNNKSHTTSLELKQLQESLWNLEDLVKVFLERISEIERELRRLKDLVAQALERVGKLEVQQDKPKQRSKND